MGDSFTFKYPLTRFEPDIPQLVHNEDLGEVHLWESTKPLYHVRKIAIAKWGIYVIIRQAHQMVAPDLMERHILINWKNPWHSVQESLASANWIGLLRDLLFLEKRDDREQEFLEKTFPFCKVDPARAYLDTVSFYHGETAGPRGAASHDREGRWWELKWVRVLARVGIIVAVLIILINLLGTIGGN